MSDVALQMLGRRKTQPIEIEEFKDLGPFTIRTLTGADRVRLTEEGKKNAADVGILLVALSLGNKDGERLFSDDMLGQVKNLPGRVLDLVALTSKEFNFIDEDAYDRAKKA